MTSTKRLALVFGLLVVLYVTAGVVTYLNDVRQDWCNAPNHPEAIVWYAIIWPIRIAASCGLN